jgi:hypothetical protein
MGCFLQSSFHPSAIDFRKGFEVVHNGQHLGLKSPHRVGGGILGVDLLSPGKPHPPQRSCDPRRRANLSVEVLLISYPSQAPVAGEAALDPNR